jgi:hypothetical protein
VFESRRGHQHSFLTGWTVSSSPGELFSHGEMFVFGAKVDVIVLVSDVAFLTLVQSNRAGTVREVSRIPAAASVSTSDDLQEVAIRIFKINTAPPIALIDLTLLRLRRIGPIDQPSIAKATKDLIEL